MRSLLVGLLLMALSDGDVENVFDYMGRQQPLGRKPVQLSTGSGGGGGVTAPVTPSLAERAAPVRQMAQQMMDGGGVDPLGISKSALKFAEEARRMFGGNEQANGAASVNPQVSAGDRAVAAGNAFPGETMGELSVGGQPSQGLSPADAATAAEAEGGATGAGAGTGYAGSALAAIGTGLNIAQDAMSSRPDYEKAIDAAIDVGGYAAGPYGMIAAPFAKMDTHRVLNDPAGMLYKGAVPGLLPISDLLSMFGGPDLISEIFGDNPSHYGMVRKGAEQAGEMDLSALQGVYHKASDPASLYHALGARAGDRGAVRATLRVPDAASGAVGLPAGAHEWSALTQQQYQDTLAYFRSNPQAIDAMVTGSGDVGYLEQGDAQGLADHTAANARTAIRRVLAMPEAAPAAQPPTMPDAPMTAEGPEGALGFAKDLLGE